MKALLVLALILSTTYIVRSQVLYEDNFESYTPGSIVGQTNFDYVHGSTDSYQIVQDETGRHLWINSLNYSVLTKNLNLWPSRNSGNNVIQVEFDYFTGGVSDISANAGGFGIWSSTYGELIGIMMRNNSKVVFGYYYSWDYGEEERALGDGTTSVVLPPNTWSRLAFSLNTVTGEAIFRGPGFLKTFQNYVHLNSDPNYGLQYMQILDGPSNFRYDNVVVKAVSSSTLGTQQPIPIQSELQLYPNPASDYVTVVTDNKILNVYVYDIQGKRSEMILNNGRIDVSHFPAGSYIIGLKTDKGFVSQKLIKR
ncbi:MAG TPA: T9SS type A sorting domain-containing protein [Flavobacterium sp.]|uniref:T9SS type A sorting domain-containing protein n=1 Tax=Flavobacterium sp. TaxID=239 RepID=UPI002CF01AAE|nr:T9SS type A sorting domain-containing protein [Flavobacterium sp.]HSD14072.1 T9SS type A sorting domain-containing protein [Flavobacterium sp.]